MTNNKNISLIVLILQEKPKDDLSNLTAKRDFKNIYHIFHLDQKMCILCNTVVCVTLDL